MTTAILPEAIGSAKILIPIGDLVSKPLITEALHILSVFKRPEIVLFHVVEVPSRTATLEAGPYQREIKDAEERLRDVSRWLTGQGLAVRTKVGVARSAADGIISEIETERYQIVFLMKRRINRGWKRFFAHSVSEKVVRSADCLVMTAPLEQP